MFGALLGITAIGLSLIYSVTGIVNFSHGDFVSLGALLATFFNAAAGGPHGDILLAIRRGRRDDLPPRRAARAAFRSIGTRAGDHFTIMVFAIGLSFSSGTPCCSPSAPSAKPIASTSCRSFTRSARCCPGAARSRGVRGVGRRC